MILRLFLKNRQNSKTTLKQTCFKLLFFLVVKLQIACFGKPQGINENNLLPSYDPYEIKTKFGKGIKEEKFIEFLLNANVIGVACVKDSDIYLNVDNYEFHLGLRNDGTLYINYEFNYVQLIKNFILKADKKYISGNGFRDLLFYNKENKNYVFAIGESSSEKKEKEKKQLQSKNKKKKKFENFEEKPAKNFIKENINTKTIVSISTNDDNSGIDIGEIDQQNMRILMDDKKFKKKINSLRYMLNSEKYQYTNTSFIMNLLIDNNYEYFDIQKNINKIITKKDFNKIYDELKNKSVKTFKVQQGYKIKKLVPIQLSERILILCITQNEQDESKALSIYNLESQKGILTYNPIKTLV